MERIVKFLFKRKYARIFILILGMFYLASGYILIVDPGRFHFQNWIIRLAGFLIELQGILVFLMWINLILDEWDKESRKNQDIE